MLKGFIHGLLVTLLLLLCTGKTAGAQQYFETVIEDSRISGWPLRIIKNDKNYIRLQFSKSDGSNGKGVFDYLVKQKSTTAPILWAGGYMTPTFEQYFQETVDKSVLIRASSSSSNIYQFATHDIFTINHITSQLTGWWSPLTIAAMNVERVNGEYFGLYTHDSLTLPTLQSDTILLCKLNFSTEQVEVLNHYVLPFVPNMAGVFFYRPADNQFDFVVDKYKVTFDLDFSFPRVVDSNYTTFLYDYQTPAGRASHLLNGYVGGGYAGDSLRVVFKDSLSDSISFRIALLDEYYSPGYGFGPKALGADSNLLVLTFVFDIEKNQRSDFRIKRFDRKGQLLEEIPLHLRTDKANISLIEEDEAGNFILVGRVRREFGNSNSTDKIYLARLNSNGSVKADFRHSAEIYLYPNPASSFIKIITPELRQNIKYQIYSAEGSFIMEGNAISYYPVAIDALASGAYILFMETLDGKAANHTLRFVKP